jgi:endo-1,3-1,4-beta-glycanase ExoK
MLHGSNWRLAISLSGLLIFMVACASPQIAPASPTATFSPSPVPTATQTATETPLPTTSPTPTFTATPSVPTLSSSQAFRDDMDTINTADWHKANGWTNGPPFWVGWRSDHVEFNDGTMSLRLDDESCSTGGCSGQPYASGEYRTNDFYHYGCIQGHLKAAQGHGIVTSLFTYTGPSDNNPHDEIDIEILGKNTTQVQLNYYADGRGLHETIIDLGFDASQDFHTYAFDWSPDTIQWYVDGILIHTEEASGGPWPVTPGRIMMNLWPGIGVNSWLSAFSYEGTPIYAYYDWVEYTPTKCIFTP